MFTGQNTLELFAANAQTIKKAFTWQDAPTKRMAALLYAQEGKAVDCEAIRQCHDLIKRGAGVFSAFRGGMALCLAALLSLAPDPQDIFDRSLRVYDLLRTERFRTSDFLAIAAYQIAARAGSADYENAVTRARSFYNDMRARHFYYTGQDDYIFAAMLGLSDMEVSTGAERIEGLYTRLKGEFWDKNGVQALAQVLVLGDSHDSAADRVIALRDALRAQKIKMDKSYTLPILGILALLPVEIGTVVHDIAAARDALRAQKGFGVMSVTTQELLLFASSIVAGSYADSAGNGVLTATLSTSITNTLVAQQATMIAAITASNAAASSS